jgi:hypothetical protein
MIKKTRKILNPVQNQNLRESLKSHQKKQNL